MTIKYYPYFRAKTYDVKAVINAASTLANNGKIVPIFEPVSDPSTTLVKHASSFGKAGLSVALVLNPQVGALIGSGAKTLKMLSDMRAAGATVIPAFAVAAGTQVGALQAFQVQFPAGAIYVHLGVPASNVATLLKAASGTHVFMSNATSSAYQAGFSKSSRILLRDGFQAQVKNAAYPPQSFFCDLHHTHTQLGYNGFGDFATVGYKFTTSGGPAYAVAIHITEDFQAQGIFCNHFLSTSNQTPTDPAGKFGEAVAALARYCAQHPGKLDFSQGCKELLQHHTAGTFPGLGSVKRMAVQHHLELMSTLV